MCETCGLHKDESKENEFYTCPCGCGYSQKEPGKCPQCGRELEKKPE